MPQVLEVVKGRRPRRAAARDEVAALPPEPVALTLAPFNDGPAKQPAGVSFVQKVVAGGVVGALVAGLFLARADRELPLPESAGGTTAPVRVADAGSTLRAKPVETEWVGVHARPAAKVRAGRSDADPWAVTADPVSAPATDAGRGPKTVRLP